MRGIEVEIFDFNAALHHPGTLEMTRSCVSTVKMSEKMSEKIMAFIVTRRFTNAVEIAREIGVTSRIVERALAKLRTSGKIKRVGPDKGGHWEVIV